MQTMVSGISISYTEEGKGVPVVFVHGFPLSRECWRPQIDSLSSMCRTIALDLRGFGASGATSGPTTMDRFADDIAALLGELDTGPAILVGHSMGGYVAFAFARRHADLLRGLVLVATRAGQDSPEAAAGRRATAEKVRAEGAKVVIDGMAPKMLAPGNEDADMEAAVRGFMEPSSQDGVIGALLGMAERPDSTPMLRQIEEPTLVVTGADDLVIDPKESQTLAQAIPGSEIHVIPDAGHLVAYEKAKEFNAILRDWVRIAAT